MRVRVCYEPYNCEHSDPSKMPRPPPQTRLEELRDALADRAGVMLSPGVLRGYDLEVAVEEGLCPFLWCLTLFKVSFYSFPSFSPACLPACTFLLSLSSA